MQFSVKNHIRVLHLPSAPATALCGLLLTCTAYAAPVAASEQGHVVLSRAGANAIIVWDASPVVSQSPTDAQAKQKLDTTLASSALSIIASRSALLSHSARATVRILYTHQVTGDEHYGGATFGSLTPLLSVTAPVHELTQHLLQWQADLAAGKIPPGVTITQLSR